MKDQYTFQKLPKNVDNLGKIIVATGFEKLLSLVTLNTLDADADKLYWTLTHVECDQIWQNSIWQNFGGIWQKI